jgi:hypothetical protein
MTYASVSPPLNSATPPMLPRQIVYSKNWLNLAAEIRLMADEMTDGDGKLIALRAAKDLDWFAEWFDLKKERRTTKRP